MADVSEQIPSPTNDVAQYVWVLPLRIGVGIVIGIAIGLAGVGLAVGIESGEAIGAGLGAALMIVLRDRR
jgi:hypothetical protein